MRRFLWLLFLLLLPLTACAETYSVSPEGLSITEALSQCASGDVIELADGVYDETLESFPLTVDQAVTIRAAEGAVPVIDAPAFKAALRIEADGVTLQNLEIRFRRTGIYAIGNDLTLEGCRISLAEEAWRTSSCGMWCGGVYRMTARDCAFTGCGISLAGPPLSESSAGKPLLTGLFEVGEELDYFVTHSEIRYPFMEWNDDCQIARLFCWANGFPLYYNLTYESHCPCWCCPFRLRTEQAFFRKSHPDLWKRLLELDQRVKEQFGDQWIGRFWKEYSLEEFSKWLEETNYP